MGRKHRDASFELTASLVPDSRSRRFHASEAVEYQKSRAGLLRTSGDPIMGCSNQHWSSRRSMLDA